MAVTHLALPKRTLTRFIPARPPNRELSKRTIFLGAVLGLVLYIKLINMIGLPTSPTLSVQSNPLSFAVETNSSLLIKSDIDHFQLDTNAARKTIPLRINAHSPWQLFIKTSYEGSNSHIYFALEGEPSRPLLTKSILLASGVGPQNIAVFIFIRSGETYENEEIPLQFELIGVL